MKHVLRSILFLIFLFPAILASGANRFWVGGNGAWTDAAHWSDRSGGDGGAGVPTLNDDVIFDAASFPLAGTCTINGDQHCRSFIWTTYATAGLLGTGHLEVSGALWINADFRDQFTGTWNFTGANQTYVTNHRFAGRTNFPSAARTIPPTPQAMTVTTTVVPNQCNGNCNATATANVSGGSGNYSFQWSTVPAQFTQTATNLCAGTYLVVVTDNVSGEQAAAFAIVVDPPPLVIFFSNTSPLCNGQCNATSSASVAGGTPGYTYDWQPGNPPGDGTPSVTGLCAGTWSLTVTDINGCQITQQSVITQPAVLNPNGASTNVTCFGLCNGSAAVAPTGGTLPYQFVWGPGGQTTNIIAPLCPGAYTCTITDNHNCTATYIANITQPQPLQVTISHTDVLCNAQCNGTATSTVSGGTGPYQYLWMPGAQTTPNLSNVCAGTYTLTVTDANLCTAQQQVTITEPPALTVNPTGVNISCFNTCNGTAAANAAGGTPGYTYQWQLSGGTGPTASGLCPGTYTVTVTDTHNCQASGQVTITQPQQLLANVSSTNVTCNGNCDGTATSNPSGGIGPYSYLWQPGNITTPGITNLCPGSYTVTVRDANNCQATATVTITQPPLLQTNVSSTNVSCNGVCDGTATSTPSGGVGPYQYLWNPGGMTTPNITGLCANTYTLTVTDANGCQRTQQVTITQPNVLNVTVNATQVACNSACTGTAAASVSGGTASYTYLWTPGNFSTPAINNLCAGSYTIQITDANGCTDVDSVALTQPTALTLATTVTNVSCNALCNGSATVTPSGGTPNYGYLWNPGGQTTQTINNLCAGSYTCTVTDANNCQNSVVINITEPQALQANITATDVTCSSACNGSASSSPSGGTAPYQYLWSAGSQTTPSITGLCIGTYTLTVSDTNGCSVQQQFIITQPSPLSAIVTSTTSSCGICNGTASVAVSGGTSPYAYFWTPTGQTNPTATGLCVGNHTVTVTDASGCTTTTVAVVSQVVNIVVTSSTTSLSCNGSCDGVASANAAGGASPYTYAWMNGGQTTQTVTGLCAGTYTVTATDANGCYNTATVSFTDPPLLTATVTSTNSSCNNSCDGTATANVSGGTGAYSYLWQPGGQTTATATGLCAGTYTCTVADANNCTVTQTFTITEPTLITANGTSNAANCTLCDGSISTAAAGGSGVYTYSWAPGSQTTPGLTNLCPGIYTVTITDNTGCSVSTPIAVSNINGPTVQATSTNATCNASCDGTSTATVTGGSSPFTYDWSPGAPVGDGTPGVTNLCAGTYFCQVTDNVGCITFVSTTITEPAPLTATPVIINTSCNAVCDGSITANASGGTGPYTYAWLPGGQTTQTISSLCAGTYTVTVTDANNCTYTQQYTVTEPAVLTASASFTNVTCYGTCNGTASVSPSGGTTPYGYNWSSGQGTSSVANLCPSTYSVTITDANGCTAQQQVTITEPTALISSITHTDASCYGVCDGTSTVTASGGTGAYTYTWSPGGGTTPTATGMCAGAYSVLTQDVNGCISVSSVTILAPPAIALTATSTAASCFAACNGTTTISGSGGTGSITYAWSPGGQTTPTASGLCSGTYTVLATDANGCTASQTASVTQPALLQANTSFTSPSCNGSCNGTATATPVGGTGPYQYLWAPGGQTTQSITNLCAGSYTVTVRDNNGCQDVQTINVVPTSPVTVTVASAPANCGSCNGTISVSPSGGATPYTYSWSNALPNQPNQSNLCAGLYTVQVTDGNGCASSFTIPLNNNGGPTGETVTTTPASCSNVCDGAASIVPTGGTGPYTYSWNPGGQTTPSVTNICAGNYFVQVTDANGCIRFSPVTVAQPTPINGSPFVSNATCTGICDGGITLNPTGGNGPYTYSWAPGGQTTSTVSSLCTGTYTVTITDANGCSQNSVSTVNAWNNLAVNLTSTPANCASACNASATATPAGGTSPYTYQWNDPLGQVSQTASGLCPGTYTVVVNDVNGCNTSTTTTIAAPTAITVSPVINPTQCNQCNGTITLNPSGGTAPYTFLWSNGATTANISGLCAGVYSVTVSDAAGCSANFSVGVSASGAPTATVTSANVTCFAACDGSASVAASGGTAPYTYNWIPGGGNSTSVSNLCAGTYFIQVMDAAGCITTESVVIGSPTAITANQTIVNTDCGTCNGSITLNPTGGTGPYTYVWAPGGQTTSSITGQCAGLYTVTITDANSCTQTLVLPVSNVNSTMSLSATSTNITCNSSCDGTATVAVSGGVAPFTYLWSNGSTNDTITNLCPGTYLVQVTDASGCVSTAAVIITQPPSLAVSFAFITNESCPGSCNGTITAIVSGGTLPYGYNWSNTQTTAAATNLCNGNYSVTVQDAAGCTITQNATITSPVVMTFSNPNVTNSSCNTVADGAIDITVNGGTLPYTFQWNGPNSFTASTEDLTNILSGTYTVIVTDAGGCQISDTITVGATVTVVANAGNDTTFCSLGAVTLDGSASVNATTYQWFELPGMTPVGNTATISVTPTSGTTSYVLTVSNGSCSSSDTIDVTSMPPPAVDAGPFSSILLGQSATIGGSPTGPGGSTFSWGPISGLGDPISANPVASPMATTTYTVVVVDTNGCSASDTVTVYVLPEIKFPNGFTPNNDGVNDVWEIDNIQLFPNCLVEVYNRWGEMLFQSPGYKDKWDGRYKGKELPVGTYYYIIKLNDPHFPQDYTGPITILRN